MFEVTAAITLFVVVHIGTIYVCAYVLRLDYPAFVAVTTVTGLIAAVIAKIGLAAWKPRLTAAINMESRDGELGRDIGVAAIIFFVGASVSNTILYRRFGLGGWLGVLGANMIATSIFPV
jgi:hypothetical protein